MTTTDKLLVELNAKRGLVYPNVGYSYFADVRGDGSNRKQVYTITNAQGGVAYDYQLNGATPRERCAKIRAELAK